MWLVLIFLWIRHYQLRRWQHPQSTNINFNKVLHDLEKISDTLFKWFTDNLLKTNPQKSHLLTNSVQETQINIGGTAISNNKREKLLGIHIDTKLTFEPHVRYLCRNAWQKLRAFARIACFLKFDQRKLPLNAFITSHFSYALVVWMFHNQKLKAHSKVWYNLATESPWKWWKMLLVSR